MRFLPTTFITLTTFLVVCSTLTSKAKDSPPPPQQKAPRHNAQPAYTATLQAAPFLNLLRPYLQAYLDQSSPSAAKPHKIDRATELLDTLGISSITRLTHTNRQINNTWLNTLTLHTDPPRQGAFKLFTDDNTADRQAFYAPASTDIAAQLSIDLDQLPELLTHIASLTGSTKTLLPILQQKLRDHSVAELCHDHQAHAHIAIDFDQTTTFNLGRIEIGRPHALIRLDGFAPLIEEYIQFFIKSRGIPLRSSTKDGITSYRLPLYLAIATAGYLPVITIDHEKNSVTIASSQAVLSRSNTAASSLADDPQFLKTWSGMPAHASAKLYISKSLLNSTEEVYLKALKEDWTNNPTFLKNQGYITQLIHDLNSSESGLAFSLTSSPSQHSARLKAPLPSLPIFLFFFSSFQK